MLTLAWNTTIDAQDLLTSFFAIFGVVFLNLEVLKRFMLLSQIDFTAFRLSGWGLLLQLTFESGSVVSAHFARRCLPIELENFLANNFGFDVLPLVLKHTQPYLRGTCETVSQWQLWTLDISKDLFPKFKLFGRIIKTIISKRFFVGVHHLTSNWTSLGVQWRALPPAHARFARKDSGSCRNDGVHGGPVFHTLDYSHRVLWSSRSCSYISQCWSWGDS